MEGILLSTMKRTIALATLALVPTIAFALDFDDVSDRYTDAPFSKAETAGISVLTDIGAVSGNPDGTFAAQRTLNRAEFLKIALLAAGEDIDDTGACFPDTPANAWFTDYICTAKNSDVVEGNPDGLYHPERPVNYAEAVKILVELYDYELPEPAPNVRWAWYTPYLLAAGEHKVSLPSSVTADTSLTRGQMARLAAAFVAEEAGELDKYRAFEKGQKLSSSSSSSSSSSVSSSVSSSSVSSVSSSSSSRASSVSSVALFPAINRLALAGTTTPVLFDGTFYSPGERSTVNSVEVELRDEVESIESIILVGPDGAELATLPLQTYNNFYRTKFSASLASGSYVLPADSATRLGIKAKLRSAQAGALSGEDIQLQSIRLYATGINTNASRELGWSDNHIPAYHMTVLSMVTGLVNTGGASTSVQQGSARMMGSFSLTGRYSTGSVINLNTLSFNLETSGVNVSNIQIGGDTGQRGSCSVEIEASGDRLVICLLPTAQQTMTASSISFNIYADVQVANGQSGTVRFGSEGAGTVQTPGAIRWSDGQTAFSRVDADARVDAGPLVTVTK